MCLGIPGKIIEVLEPDAAGSGDRGAGALSGLRRGVVDFGGVRKEVCLSCVEDAGPGDYVIVHVGFAISRIDAQEAERVFELIREMAGLEELGPAGEAGGALPPDGPGAGR
jgi:hydrogenase expression/formation protein HypC